VVFVVGQTFTRAQRFSTPQKMDDVFWVLRYLLSLSSIRSGCGAY